MDGTYQHLLLLAKNAPHIEQIIRDPKKHADAFRAHLQQLKSVRTRDDLHDYVQKKRRKDAT